MGATVTFFAFLQRQNIALSTAALYDRVRKAMVRQREEGEPLPQSYVPYITKVSQYAVEWVQATEADPMMTILDPEAHAPPAPVLEYIPKLGGGLQWAALFLWRVWKDYVSIHELVALRWGDIQRTADGKAYAVPSVGGYRRVPLELDGKPVSEALRRLGVYGQRSTDKLLRYPHGDEYRQFTPEELEKELDYWMKQRQQLRDSS